MIFKLLSFNISASTLDYVPRAMNQYPNEPSIITNKNGADHVPMLLLDPDPDGTDLKARAKLVRWSRGSNWASSCTDFIRRDV